MNKKQILCTGLSLALLLSSVITTPASIAAGKYFKIQYIHSKKKVKKKAINARYNNKVISTKIPGYIEGSTSMYSAYWIFGHCSSLGTKYSYSSSKKRVTLQRNSQKLYHGSRRYRCKKTRLKLFMEQSPVIRSDLKGQYC